MWFKSLKERYTNTDSIISKFYTFTMLLTADYKKGKTIPVTGHGGL
jgi:hypothetical protein